MFLQKGYKMDYKKELIKVINETTDVKFLQFLYEVVISFKKKWGI